MEQGNSGGEIPSGRLSAREVTEFSRRFSELTRAGLPLPGGFRALAEELPAGRLKRLFAAMARRLEAGASLDEVLKAYARNLPDHLRGLVLVGLRSGDLAVVLDRYATCRQQNAALRRAAWVILAYPILLLATVATMLGFVLLCLVPLFEQIFIDFGYLNPFFDGVLAGPDYDRELPGLTMALIRLSILMRTFGFELAVVAACLIAAAWFTRNTKMAWRLRRRIPVIGPLWRWSATAEFFRLLGLLTDRDVPMPLALTLAGDSVADPLLQGASRRVSRQVDAGQAMSRALTDQASFSQQLRPLLAWAEAHQALPDSLDAVGAMYEDRIRQQMMLLREIGPHIALPVVAFLLFCLFVVIVQGLFMPVLGRGALL